MGRSTSVLLLLPAIAGGPLAGAASAVGHPLQAPGAPASLVETSPSLAPLQHVRFCIRYPADCKSNPAEDERIDLTNEKSELLTRINRRVNGFIAPVEKDYGKELEESWTLAPYAGDCNDFVVTKRHELLLRGLPAKALRLAVVATRSGDGHLVLLVMTTKGDLVLDNLSDEIVPWQSTDYRWLKIQSGKDARFWYNVKTPGAVRPQPERALRVVDQPRSSPPLSR